MNVNTSTNYGQVAVFGAHIGVGAIIAVSNIVIIVCVFSYQALRRQKEFVLLGALALADAINQGNAIPAYIYRSWLLLAGRMATGLTPIDCMLKPHTFIWMFSNQMASAMLVAISMDRLLLVAFPYVYLKLTMQYAYGVVITVYISSICMGTMGAVFVVTNDQEAIHSPLCMTTPSILGASHDSPLRSLYAEYLAKSPILLAILSVILYACIYPVNALRKSVILANIGLTGDTRRELRRQRRLTKHLAIACVCTFCLYCVPFQLAIFYKNKGMLHVAAVFFLTCTLNAFTNLIIYQWKIPEMRTALKSLMHRKDLPLNLKLWPKHGESVNWRKRRKRRNRRATTEL